MANTKNEVATTEANTIGPNKHDRQIADIVALCAWNFSEAVRDLETCEEWIYASRIRRYKEAFDYWKTIICVYDEDYEGLDQRLKRQPDFRLLFERTLDMLNKALHSITFDYENATSPEEKVQNIWLRLRFISRSIQRLQALNFRIRAAARPMLQNSAETYLEGSMTYIMFRERFKNKATMALLGLYPGIFWPFLRRLQESMGSQHTRFLYWNTQASPMQQSSIRSPNTKPQQNRQLIEGGTPTFVQFDENVAFFPNPPQLKGEENKKRCPICREVFSKSNFDNVSWWRETSDSSNDCNDPQAAAATENLHVTMLANDHELNHLHYGAMLSHIADHLQTFGLLALKMSKTALSAKEKKKIIDLTTIKSYDDDPDVLGQNTPEDILADVLSHQEESIKESMATTMRTQSINGETTLEQKATLWQDFGDGTILLDKVQQIRLTYDNLLERALGLYAGGNLDLPPKVSAALARIEDQTPRRIGEPDTFTQQDLYDFFDGLFSTIHCGEEGTIVDYCTDQVWTARRYHDKRRPTGESFASRRRIFSILMIHKSPEAILGFIKERITDFHIPISEDTLRQKFPTWTDGFIDSFLMIQSQYLFTVPCAENISRPDQYTIAWICDTPTQCLAARTFLDEEHSLPEGLDQYDGVVFTLGTVAGNKIVIAAPLYRKCDTMTAAAVMQNVLKKFPSINASLIVGLGGGMPSSTHDISLGDVVVGTTQKGQSSVFQYDFDETVQKRAFQKMKFMNQLPGLLQKAVESLNTKTDEGYSSPLYDVNPYEEGAGEIFQGTIKRRLEYFPRFLRKYERPSSRTDKVFITGLNSYLRPRRERLCEYDELIREPPRVHYGLIASSDQQIKDYETRDLLKRDKNVLCFDKEAAGLTNHPCLVIRGICQYLDSDSEPETTWKIWQDYSAITAATYANEILKALPPIDIGAEADFGDADVLPGTARFVGQHPKARSVSQLRNDRDTILSWLSSDDKTTPKKQNNNGIEYRGIRHIHDEQDFEKWCRGYNQILFLSGEGAVDKVTISTMADLVYSKSRNESRIGIARIHIPHNWRTKRAFDILLESILRQLVEGLPDVSFAVERLYCSHNGETRPCTDELTNSLNQITGQFAKTFVLIDTLSEPQSFSKTKLRSTILDTLQHLPRTNILVMFRNCKGMKGIFRGTHTEGNATRGALRTSQRSSSPALEAH